MYDLAGENELDLEALRMRLRGMDDTELLRFGRSARYMCCISSANGGNAPGRAGEFKKGFVHASAFEMGLFNSRGALVHRP